MAIKRILIFALLAATANAEVYYVRPGGSNSNDGLSWANAWQHPNKTNTGTNGNDTILISPAPYDTVDIRPFAGNFYACSTLVSVDTADVLRSSTRLSGAVNLGGTWTSRGSNIWRHDQLLPPRWNAWTTSGVAGHPVLIRDGALQHSVEKNSGTPFTDLDAAGEYYYDYTNDSLFVYSTSDPSGSTFRYGQAPVVRFQDGTQDGVTFYGLTLEEGYQGIILMGNSDFSPLNLPDSILITHCNLWKTSLPGAGLNLGILFSGGQAAGMALDDWGRFNTLRSCSLDYAWAPADDLGGGGATDFYSQREFTADSNYFGPNLRAGGIMLKNGGNQGAYLCYNIVIAYNVFDGHTKAGIWLAQMMDSVLIYGNIFKNCAYRAIDIHTTPSAAWSLGRVKMFNNTFFNCGGGGAAAITLTQRLYDTTGTNEVRYNVFYDTTSMAEQVHFTSQGEAAIQTPPLESVFDIDSNRYYFKTAGNFTTRFISGSGCTGTNLASWQSCGFDVQGDTGINPNFAVAGSDFSRPSASGEMNRTYGGRTWTIYGAVQNAAAESCIVITSLPYTASTADTCYCLQDRKMASTGTGITATARNVRILNRYGTRDTLEFGTDGGDDYRGVKATADNFKIDGLYVWHHPSGTNDSAKNNICVYIENVDTAKIWRTHVRPAGRNGRGLQNNSGGFDIDIWRLKHDSTAVVSYESRCNHLANIMYLIPEADHDDGNYFVKVHACSVSNAPHNILAITGGASAPSLFYVDSNFFTVDAHNDMYTLTDGQGDACKSSGDAAGIDILGSDGGSRISYNKIRSGSNFEGGVGMLLQAMFGQLGDSVLIVGNDVDVSNGPSSRFGAGRTFAMYMRYVPGSGNSGSQYVAIRDNIWKTTIDTDTATEHIGREAETWSLILSGCGAGANASDSFKYIDFSRNTVQLATSGTVASGYEGSAIAWGNCDSSIAAHGNNGYISFKNNHYISPRVVVELANMQGIPGSNWLSIGDTIDATFNTDSTITFDRTGSYTGHSTNNRIQDAVWLNNADDASIGFDTGGNTDNDSLGESIVFRRTFRGYVLNSSGSPVSGASVWLWNSYTDTVLAGTTNGSGYIEGVVDYKFESYDKFGADTYVLSDSAFNDFTFKGKSGSDSAQVTVTITASVARDTVQFATSTPSAMQIIRGVVLKGALIK